MTNAYLVTLGSLILVAGSVSDALRRGLVLLVGFAVASAAIALAQTVELVVALLAVIAGGQIDLMTHEGASYGSN